MKRTFYISLIAAILVSCSTDTTAGADANSQETVHNMVTPNQVLTVEIDGMVCVMGCGGSIRKELYELGGVSEVDFDFEEERETNIARVSFDTNVVDVDKIVEVLSHMNDGQFTVGKISTESIDSISSHSTQNEDEESIVSVSTTSIRTPNLLDLLSEIIL